MLSNELDTKSNRIYNHDKDCSYVVFFTSTQGTTSYVIDAWVKEIQDLAEIDIMGYLDLFRII